MSIHLESYLRRLRPPRSPSSHTLPHLCSCLSSPHRVFASLDHGQVSSNIDNFLSLMPEGVVEAATAQILEENALNEKEYQSEDGDNNVINPITLKDIK